MATVPTRVTRPRTRDASGSSTSTLCPAWATVAAAAASSSVTTCRVEVVVMTGPPPPASPTWPVSSVTRRVPGRKTMRPSSTAEPAGSPRAARQRRTAAAVAASNVRSTVIAPYGSWPSATRLRSSWRTSSPPFMPSAIGRWAGRRPSMRITGFSSTSSSRSPRLIRAPLDGSHVIVPWRRLAILRESA